MRWFVFPICHTHVLALLSHDFKSVTDVYSVIFSLQRWCTGCCVAVSDPRCLLPVTVYGTTHAHLVHMCWLLLWGLHQMGRSSATCGAYSLVGSLKWIMRVLNSQGSRLWWLLMRYISTRAVVTDHTCHTLRHDSTPPPPPTHPTLALPPLQQMPPHTREGRLRAAGLPPCHYSGFPPSLPPPPSRTTKTCSIIILPVWPGAVCSLSGPKRTKFAKFLGKYAKNLRKKLGPKRVHRCVLAL